MVRICNAVARQRPADTVTLIFLAFLLFLTGIFYEFLPTGAF